MRRGYLSDPYIALLSSEETHLPPLMNRGTFIRTTAIDSLFKNFLRDHRDTPTQVLVLGAGSDTRFFQYKVPQFSVSL